MQHKVLEFFIDKVEGTVYYRSSLFVSEDSKRLAELEKLGLIEVNKEFKPKKKAAGVVNATTESQASTTN